ncbi:hypothetical protein LCGC14_2441840, partial [marine sediment metagenome]
EHGCERIKVLTDESKMESTTKHDAELGF